MAAYYSTMDDLPGPAGGVGTVLRHGRRARRRDRGTLIAGIKLYGSDDANVFMNDDVFPLDKPQIQQSIDAIGSVLALVHPDIPLDQAKVDGSYVSSVSR